MFALGESNKWHAEKGEGVKRKNPDRVTMRPDYVTAWSELHTDHV